MLQYCKNICIQAQILTVIKEYIYTYCTHTQTGQRCDPEFYIKTDSLITIGTEYI